MVGRRGEDDYGETPLNVGKDLDSLGKAGLAEKPDTEKKLWLITDKDRKCIENPPVPSDRPSNRHSSRPLRPTTQTDHQNHHQSHWVTSNLKPSPHNPTSSDPLGRGFEGYPRGNFTGYCDFCFTLGEQYLGQYMLKKRGYK